MAKRSYKRPMARCKKEHPGCMGGLISIFHFRHGRSSQRLISDWTRGSGKHAIGAGYSNGRLNLPTDGDKEHIGKDVTASSNLYERNEIKTAKIEYDQASVKALIDDEMSKVQFSMKQTARTSVQQIPPYLECRCGTGNNHKQRCKSCKIASNQHLHDSGASPSLDPKPSYCPNLTERPSLMEQEMHLNHRNRIDSFIAHRSSTYMNMQRLQKHVVKEKLNEATESFLNQKLKDARRLIKDGATHQSKEFMDALELLNSNKELFLKLLQDPNSLLVKHIEDLRKAQSEKLSKEEMGNSTQSEKPINHKKFRKQNIHNFFRRKDKTEDRSKSPTKVSDSSFASNRIVVLKPSPESSQNSTATRSPSSIQRSHYILRKEIESERVTTKFSIREITSNLKNAIGESSKEQHWIPIDGILHTIPYEHQDSTEISKRNAVKNQSRVETEVARRNSDHCTNSNKTAIGLSQKKVSTFYKEGNPADIRSIYDVHEDSQTRRVSRAMGGMPSLPEYSKSPRFSPGRDSGPTSFRGHTRFFPPCENFLFGNENTWQFRNKISAESSSPCRPKFDTCSFTDCNNNDSEQLQLPSSNSGLLKEHITDAKIHMNIGSSPKGCNVITQESDVDMEDNKPLVVPSESEMGITIVDNNIAVTDKVGEEGSFEYLRMDSCETPILASTLGPFAGSPLLIHKINVPSIIEKPERPSPVSVLEPFFIEGVVSPASPQQELAEEPLPMHHEEQKNSPLPMTTLDPKISLRTCIEGKEDEFEYVNIVMEASGFKYSECFGRWHSSDQPLSPSLFDQVEVSSSHLSNNKKLLFDCINEVLVEVYERFFSCSPWVSSVNMPIPIRKHLIQEVWQGIDWHLLPQFPRPLDQIIGKDMAKAGSWMDLRLDVEAVSCEIGESILEKMMEEMILELWD